MITQTVSHKMFKHIYFKSIACAHFLNDVFPFSYAEDFIQELEKNNLHYQCPFTYDLGICTI